MVNLLHVSKQHSKSLRTANLDTPHCPSRPTLTDHTFGAGSTAGLYTVPFLQDPLEINGQSNNVRDTECALPETTLSTLEGPGRRENTVQ